MYHRLYFIKNNWVAILLVFGISIQYCLGTISKWKASDSIQDNTICPSQLPSLVQTILNRPEFKHSHWGVSIAVENNSSNGYTTLFSSKGDDYFLPASNNKLLTNTALFPTLDPNYQYHTPFYLSQGRVELLALFIHYLSRF
jgi:D-alanyl-D-alanine carboxypeptidase/D-alanyl-D-alanine-endopeptidase (penicillin-binding protein 4)